MQKLNLKKRANSIIDEIDLDIIMILYSLHNKKKEVSILDLTKIVGVAHSSLKAHIEKLEDLGIIIKDNSPKGRKTLIKLNHPKVEKGLVLTSAVVSAIITSAVMNVMKETEKDLF